MRICIMHTSDVNEVLHTLFPFSMNILISLDFCSYDSAHSYNFIFYNNYLLLSSDNTFDDTLPLDKI